MTPIIKTCGNCNTKHIDLSKLRILGANAIGVWVHCIHEGCESTGLLANKHVSKEMREYLTKEKSK